MRKHVAGIGVAVLLGVASAMAGEPAGGKTPTVEIAVWHDTGKESEAERTSSFVLGDKAVCVFWVRGFQAVSNNILRLQGSWEMVDPNGKVVAMEKNIMMTATNVADESQGAVALQTMLAWPFLPTAPAGSYYLRVSVTDAVNRTTASASAPLFVFLTPGAKAQIISPITNAPTALDTTLLSPGFWTMTLDDFAASTWADGFGWVSQEKTTVRSASRRMTFLGQPLYEAQVRFADEHPAEVTLSFYNRGDAGEIPNVEFTNKTSALMRQLKTLTERPPLDLTPQRDGTPNQKTIIMGGTRGPTFIRLEYAWSSLKREGAAKRGFVPEFINMALLPSTNLARSAMAGTQSTRTAAYTLAKRVKRTPDGDVYIDGVPMVDQGEKSYCAAAAMERVMDYYGTDVDQYEIAQRILMQTSGGASFDSMVRGLRAIAHTLNVQVKMLIEQDERAFVKLVEDYNKLAKKRGIHEIDLYHQNPTFTQDPAYTNSIWELFDKDLFLASRLKEKIAMEKFFKMVQNKIDIGIPLFNCCIIGILPEEAKLGQDPGGHLRLIIGYNARTKEVLYTDSWGPGHERKRMSLEYTFAITTGLFTLEPK